MTTETNWMITGDHLTEYLTACKEADLATFKQDRRLTRIFEHASVRQGMEYLRLIHKQTPKLLRHVWTNDKLGSPVLHHFGESNRSPSTMQYIGVLSNLLCQVGPLDGLRIVEIGGGYGGQCRTILDWCKPAVYSLVDLPEVIELQKRYLHGLPVTFHVEAPTDHYDLFLSNYALSEIPDNSELVALAGRCKHGYITCNTELVQLPFAHKRLPDIGSERKENFILVW